jgi:cysteinyl-tRNA synthetase
MPLRIYNSLTRKKEDFAPINPGRVHLYVCGPTVYGPPHLGHAKTAIAFDIVNRWLRFRKDENGKQTQVRFVQNITDVGHLVADADEGDDKVAAEARRLGLQPMEVAERWTREYFEDMAALGVRPPDISPRATGHIPEQIELTQQLVEKGFAYVVDGSVYFDVTKFHGYGKLSGRRVEEAESGTRVAVKSEKRNPADFALWKKAEPGHIMQWNSPWGRGFPGWHVECSAMSMKYLGETFDIHGGGMDLKFPHHEDEIAQSEAATGQPFVKTWMHAGLITINGKKMSKSEGNYITLKELFAGPQSVDEKRRDVLKLSKAYDPLVLRLLILQNHYGSNLDISDENLKAAQFASRNLAMFDAIVTNATQRGAGGPAEEPIVKGVETFRSEFTEAMDDDFATPRAIAALNKLENLVSPSLRASANAPTKAGMSKVKEALDECNGILGVINAEWADEVLTETAVGMVDLGRHFSERAGSKSKSQNEGLRQILLDTRSELRKPAAELAKAAKKMPPEAAEVAKGAADKLFAMSDDIRKRMTELGLTVEDKKIG